MRVRRVLPLALVVGCAAPEAADGPAITLDSPRLTAFELPGPETATASVDNTGIGDSAVATIDPGTAAALSIDAAIEDGRATFALPETAAGPHQLQVQVRDAANVPLDNAAATDGAAFFVHDPVTPGAPQVALAWPLGGSEHVAGDDLLVEVAVAPDTFEFVAQTSDPCRPTADCDPVFGPECEAACGPVSRVGTAKLFAIDDYPGCLADATSCQWEYIYAFAPQGDVEADGPHVLRAIVPGDHLPGPGAHTLTIALSYTDHTAYPSDDRVVYHSIPITMVE